MLEAIKIRHEFQRGTPLRRRVVDDVSLTLTAGETVLLTGPNGSGKTTLARILAGLEVPAQGTVRFNGADLYGGKDRWITAGGRRVAMAFQYPERQFFANTVWEELSWGLRVGLGMERAEIFQRLRAVSAELAFSTDQVAARPPRTLSSGQQRKAALVSLLALEPQVLILDEPLAGLTGTERKRLSELLRNWPNRDRVMLIIAHELDLFLNWVETVAVMASGRLVFSGSPNDLCTTETSLVTEAISLPPLIELSRYLKKYGLSEGPVSNEAEIVYPQLEKALTSNQPGEMESRES
ncbi:MAG: ABC transporter ATP-binding protein [Deltaproteobacteria bacterium]|nr:MAG: ABC transporter ATP-binding protein [Deltaproteobacteria bacterium]